VRTVRGERRPRDARRYHGRGETQKLEVVSRHGGCMELRAFAQPWRRRRRGHRQVAGCNRRILLGPRAPTSSCAVAGCNRRILHGPRPPPQKKPHHSRRPHEAAVGRSVARARSAALFEQRGFVVCLLVLPQGVLPPNLGLALLALRGSFVGALLQFPLLFLHVALIP